MLHNVCSCICMYVYVCSILCVLLKLNGSEERIETKLWVRQLNHKHIHIHTYMHVWMCVCIYARYIGKRRYANTIHIKIPMKFIDISTASQPAGQPFFGSVRRVWIWMLWQRLWARVVPYTFSATLPQNRQDGRPKSSDFPNACDHSSPTPGCLFRVYNAKQKLKKQE